MFGLFLLPSCLGLEVDKVSESVLYEPTVSLPLGWSEQQYDSVDDLPVLVPPDYEPFSFTEEDRIAIDLSEVYNHREYLVSLLLRFDITNKFPANTTFEILYIDAPGNEHPLNSASPIEVEKANVNEDGVVISATKSLHDIPIDEADLDGLFNARYLLIRLHIYDLTLTPFIRSHFNTYSTNCAIGVRAQTSIQIN